jgi:mannosyl-oligosaccharide alpha-1,2-mannosidase
MIANLIVSFCLPGWGWYNASNEAYDPSWDTDTDYRAQAEEYGYFITGSQYDSFPETIESIFYAYRITGDSRWQDYQWEIFQALERESTATIPSAPISDVEVPQSFISELPRYVKMF